MSRSKIEPTIRVRSSSTLLPPYPAEHRPEDRGNKLEEPQEQETAKHIDKRFKPLGDLTKEGDYFFIKHTTRTPPRYKRLMNGNRSETE